MSQSYANRSMFEFGRPQQAKVQLCGQLDVQAKLPRVLERVCRDRGESVGVFVRMAALKELAALGAFDNARAKSFGITVVDLSTGRVEANRKP